MAANKDMPILIVDGYKTMRRIISDWKMEPMTGYQLLKDIRNGEALAATPFVMVTAEPRPIKILPPP